MWNRIERLSAPAAEALTLDEVKAHCRVDGTDQDAFLISAIKAARQLMEGPDGAGLALVASSWRMSFDAMPSEIWIPMGPVISIDEIAYVDEGGDDQTVEPDGFQWRRGSYEARIKPAYGLTWPSVRRQYNAVQVTFTAGFPGTDDNPIKLDMVPEPLRKAMLMVISHWNENRETAVLGQAPAEIQFGFNDLVNRYRVGRFA